MRQDVDNGFYLEGRLAWREGQGTISWNSAPSEDPGGPGTDAALDVYTSEPLPMSLRINASRLIELDLYLEDPTTHQGTKCPAVRGAEVRVDGRLLGGLPASAAWAQPNANAGFGWPYAQYPPDPPGFGVCRLRILSEWDHLSEGSVLEVRLTRATAAAPRYGMGEGHQSIIRIPYYAEGELPYRFPAYAHGRPIDGQGNGGIGGLLPVLGGFGGLAVARLARSAPRSRTAVALVMAFLAAISGCASPSSPLEKREGSPVSATIEPAYEPAASASNDTGALLGQVVASDVGEAVHGAAVSLLGTSRFAYTDPYGRFSFVDLEPATYRLRVDRQAYHSVETEVEVRPGQVAKVEILLRPLGTASADQRPHRHDYWGADTTKTLLENEDLGYWCESLPNGFTCHPSMTFAIPVSDQGYSSILPGTYGIDVTVEWDPQRFPTDWRVGLKFQANHDPSIKNATYLLPRGPGEPFHVPVSWEMDDPGHQRFSTWVFALFGSGSSNNPDEQIERFVNPATYRVTLSITKGTIGLEPGHADLWGPNRTVVVVDGPPESRTRYLQGPDDDVEIGRAAQWDAVWIPLPLIPPETQWLEIVANWTREPIVSHEFELRYHPASRGPPTADCWYTQFPQDCDDASYETRVETAGKTTRWVFPLADREPDPVYAIRSFWVFGLRPSPTATNALASTLDHAAHGASATPDEVSLRVVAHRDPLPA